MSTPDYTFDYEAFILAFPAFSDPDTFPESTLQGFWDVATLYLEPYNYGVLSGASRGYALNILTAHLTAISVLVAAGKTPLILNSGTVNQISVGVTPPPFGTSDFKWWLQTTPYGSQLAALLTTKIAGGWMVNGTAEGLAIRTYAGGFGGRLPFGAPPFGTC